MNNKAQYKHRNILSILATCIIFTLISSNLTAQESFFDNETRARLQELIDSPNRSEDLRVRNQYRHPLETLEFFEVSSRFDCRGNLAWWDRAAGTVAFLSLLLRAMELIFQ